MCPLTAESQCPYCFSEVVLWHPVLPIGGCVNCNARFTVHEAWKVLRPDEPVSLPVVRSGDQKPLD